MVQGIAYHCSKVKCEDHSAIQAPQASVLLELVQFSRLDVVHSNKSRVHVVHDVSRRQLHYQEVNQEDVVKKLRKHFLLPIISSISQKWYGDLNLKSKKRIARFLSCKQGSNGTAQSHDGFVYIKHLSLTPQSPIRVKYRSHYGRLLGVKWSFMY